MIHLYAFVQGLRSLPSRTGVAGEVLELRSFGGVEAVVGTTDAPVVESVESALSHGLVAEALLDCADAVLPARFAKPFAHDAALEHATTPLVPELRARLAGVSGCVELSVRIGVPPPPPAQASADGTSYLRALSAATVERDSQIAETHGALAGHALDSRVEPITRGAALFRGAYLVRRLEIDAFAREVDRLAARFPDASIVCTGPWAPSSFAQEAA
jgi:Gas vesicle synthesis protein GvpL/GvpF